MSIIKLITTKEVNNWEIQIIKGALNYHNIYPFLLKSNDLINPHSNLCIYVPTKKKDIHDLFLYAQKVKNLIIVGHYATAMYFTNRFKIPSNAILIYGEPYTTLPLLLRSQIVINRNIGKAIQGELFNPNYYCCVNRKMVDHSSQVLTSIGCERNCAYCSFGIYYGKIYGHEFKRRNRNWIKVKEELKLKIRKGIKNFTFVADQFLSEDKEKNNDIRYLLKNWKKTERKKINVSFTVSPKEVLNNRDIISDLANSFQICPRLSIDSFDDKTLNLLNRRHNALEAVEALRFLSTLQIHIRINYIFIRPFMNLDILRKECRYFKLVSSILSYLGPFERFQIAYDLFSRRLKIVEWMQIQEKFKINRTYEDDFPASILVTISNFYGFVAKRFEFFDKSEDILEDIISYLSNNTSKN